MKSPFKKTDPKPKLVELKKQLKAMDLVVSNSIDAYASVSYSNSNT